MEGVQNIQGVIFITYYTFTISLETANTQKSEVFISIIYSGNVNAFIQRMLLLPDILEFTKKSFRKTSFFVLTVTGVMVKKCFFSCIFQIIVIIAVTKTFGKYL